MMRECGYTVSVIGRRDPPAEDRQPGVRYWIGDVLDSATMESTLTEILGACGPLRYLVFSHRYRGEGDPWTGELEATLTATRTVLDRTRGHFDSEGDRAILMVSSVFGDFIGEGQPVGYHVAKAGLNQLMRYYAVELGREGVRVNAVTPFTYLKEESQDFYLGHDALQELYGRIVPLGRMATTEDVANVVMFLCSAQAAYVNGQNLYVDGGLSLVWPETLARRLEGV